MIFACVFTVKNKIIYRAGMLLIIQKNLRMLVATKIYRPRIRGIIKLRTLTSNLEQMEQMNNSLKKDKDKASKEVKKVEGQLQGAIKKLQDTRMTQPQIDQLYNEMLKAMNSGLADCKKRLEKQKIKEEEERMRKIQVRRISLL